MIQDTSPIWIYCRQKVPSSHCAAGMVFAINPGPGQLAAFQAAAKATGNTNNATATSATSSAATISASPTAASTSAAATASTQTNHKVLVGEGGTLSYSPPNITAQAGDTITFEFRAKNHTVSQSSFAAPCRLLGATSGTPGFDSGL